MVISVQCGLIFDIASNSVDRSCYDHANTCRPSILTESHKKGEAAEVCLIQTVTHFERNKSWKNVQNIVCATNARCALKAGCKGVDPGLSKGGD